MIIDNQIYGNLNDYLISGPAILNYYEVLDNERKLVTTKTS